MKRVFAVAAALFALAVIAPSASAASSLVGQWHLDEGSGTTVADSSGNGNNGSFGTGLEWVSGRFGTALSFDGSTGQVLVPDNNALAPGTAISVSAWVKNPGSPGLYRYIVAKGATRCIAASYGLYTGPNGGLDFYVSSSRGTVYDRSPAADTRVWDGGWHIAVGTFDGKMVRLYVDGSEIGSGTKHTGTLEYTLPNPNDFFIGDYPACSGRHFQGSIDEVNVWNTALSAAEVLASYQQATHVPTGGAAPPVIGSPTTPLPGGGTRTTPGGTGSNRRIPAIRGLKLTPAAFRLGHGHASHPGKSVVGTMITYTSSQAARRASWFRSGRPASRRGGGASRPRMSSAAGRRAATSTSPSAASSTTTSPGATTSGSPDFAGAR